MPTDYTCPHHGDLRDPKVSAAFPCAICTNFLQRLRNELTAEVKKLKTEGPTAEGATLMAAKRKRIDRDILLTRAGAEFGLVLCDFIGTHKLTLMELVQIINDQTARLIGRERKRR